MVSNDSSLDTSNEANQIAYLVPDQKRKDLILEALNQATGLRMISEDIHRRAARKVLTYAEFLHQPNLIRDWRPDNIVPVVLAQYILLRVIGIGGTSIVYEALDTQHHDRHVPIKVDNLEPDENWELDPHIENEAAVYALLSRDPDARPFIPAFYGSGADDAENIFIRETANGIDIKIVDFGTAWMPKVKGFLRAGNFTPLYAPPEVNAGLPGTDAADVYSLGVSLVDLVLDPAVLAPLRGPVTLEYYLESLERSLIPRYLKMLIDNTLLQDPRSRSTIDEFAAALEHYSPATAHQPFVPAVKNPYSHMVVLFVRWLFNGRASTSAPALSRYRDAYAA